MTELNTPKIESSDAPLVSVVIPFFNAAKYLRESIESVLRQSYVNWELLLIDDGSTDGGREIAKGFEQLYPEKIICLEHPDRRNRGQSASRNVGVKQSRGDLLTFLDADDVFLPHALKDQVSMLCEHPDAGALIAQTLYWRTWPKPSAKANTDYIVPFGVPLPGLFRPPTLLRLWYPLGPGPAPCMTGLIIRREVFETIGGFEESFHGDRGLYEDQCVLSKLYLAAPVYLYEECVGKYRQHPESSSAKGIKEGLYDKARLCFLQWFAEYLKQNGIDDKEVHSLLLRAMWPYEHRVAHACLSFPANTLKAAKSITKNILGM